MTSETISHGPGTILTSPPEHSALSSLTLGCQLPKDILQAS